MKYFYDEMQASYLHDPVFSEPHDAAILLTLENSATSRVLRQSDSMTADFGEVEMDALNEYEVAAMQYAYSHAKVTVKDLTKHLDRSAKVSRKILRGLVEKRMLKWHGTSTQDPSQFYSRY